MSDAQKSVAWKEACDQLAEEIGRWISGAIRRNEPIPFQGGHDECNYTATWPQFSTITGDEAPIAFCKKLRDQLIAWPELHHGFYPDAKWDIEHSVENWTVFMTSMAEADPGDDVTASCIEDVAHHLGNWADGCPEWFDWERRRFVSEWVGTREVRDEPPYDFSTYWDARASELALTMYDLRGDERYLEFAVTFAGGWAEHMLAQEGLGYWLMLDADTSDREGFKEQYEEYPEDFHARNIGWIREVMRHMLHVYSRVGGDELVDASLKIIALAPGAMEAAGRPRSTYPEWQKAYQEATGDLRFAEEVEKADQAACAAARDALSQPLPEIVMLEGLAPYPTRLYAYRDERGGLHQLEGPGPQALMEAWKLTGEEELGVRAMQLAARQLHLAATTLRDGREHGCNGRYIHGAGGEAMRVFAAASE